MTILTQGAATCRATRLLLTTLLVLSAQSARATTGISALGALLDAYVFLAFLAGAMLACGIIITIAYRRGQKDPGRGVVLPIVATIYVVFASMLYYQAHPNSVALALGIVTLVVGIASTVLATRTLAARWAVAMTILAIAGTATFLHPHALAFHERIYVDNFAQLNHVAFAVPGYWRIMELEDKRRMLDLRPYRRDDGRVDSGRRRYDSPAVFTALAQEDGEQRYAIQAIEQTSGAWGWSERNDTAYVVPLFQPVTIQRFESSNIGTAALLSENTSVDASYLFEAVSEKYEKHREPRITAWIKELSERGADIDYVNAASGESVLIRALRADRSRAAIKHILRAKPDLSYANPRNGDTALHVAALSNRANVRLLLAAGADTATVNLAGETPEQKLAHYIERQEANKAILSAGSRQAASAILALLNSHKSRK